jgi:transcriptional regulator with XRE-family HTH domain
MAKRKDPNFGQVIRDRRRQLDLTQQEIARRIKTSTPYVGHLESGKRHPSDKVLRRLAEVLRLDCRQLFLLANPHSRIVETEPNREPEAGWGEFRKMSRCSAPTISGQTRSNSFPPSPRWVRFLQHATLFTS